MAVAINESKALGLDPEQIRAAAMLHDIGIYMCDAPSIECHAQSHTYATESSGRSSYVAAVQER